jgi:methenyltetrahydrofolate cyclohydrolase
MQQDPASAFWKVLDPADNTTGGGSASAIAGAMAAALVAMVGRLSRSKAGAADPSFYDETCAAAEDLSRALLDGSRDDSQAFEGVRAAFGLPKGTDEEKQARLDAIQAAWLRAARVPLDNAERCAAVLNLAHRLEGRSNPNVASDLACALHLAHAGMLGCIENVKINLPAIRDPQAAGVLSERLQALANTIGG